MKVGLITMHNVANYGAVLQTFALMEKIKDITGDCEIIDYIPEIRHGLKVYFPPEELPFYRKVASWIKWFGPRVSWQKTFNDFQHKRYSKKTVPLYLNNIDKINNQYDAYVTGSDQVWNPSSTRGLDRAYFLDFVDKNKKKISYAASISKTNLSSEEKVLISKYLKGYTGISVREGAVCNTIQELTEKRVVQCIDPTVLVGKAFWSKFVSDIDRQIQPKYCLMYILGECTEAIDFARDIAKKLDLITARIALDLISGTKKSDVDLRGVTPEQYVRLFLDSECVVTNSLHGILFSIISEKNFCIPVSIVEQMRFKDVIRTYGLERYQKMDEKNKMIIFTPDYKELSNDISRMREAANAFLVDSLIK